MKRSGNLFPPPPGLRKISHETKGLTTYRRKLLMLIGDNLTSGEENTGANEPK